MSPKVWSVEVTPASQTPKGETPVRRSLLSPNALTETPDPAISTIFDLVQFNARRWGDKPCFGTRKVIKIHTEKQAVPKAANGVSEPKVFMYWELGPYEFRSYKQVAQEALDVGCGLRKLGLGKDDKLAIYAETSAHWQLIAQGALSQSLTIVTAYATLGEEGLSYSLKETNAKAIFLDPTLILTLLKPLQSCPSVQFIIYHGEPSEKDIATLREAHKHLTIVAYDEVLQLGKSNPVDPVPPMNTDIACVMYTSGSVGRPKGVLLTHRNLIATRPWFDGKNIRTLGYLPLAHVYEFIFEMATQYWGATIGYARFRTLTDTWVRNCKGDLREFRPQLFPSVPAVWELIRKGIEARVAESSPLAQALFWGSMWIKEKMLSYGIPGTSLFDMLVFNKVKEVTGGHVFWSIYGGSSLSIDTQKFVCTAIAPTGAGYGMTETCAMGSISNPDAWAYGASGPIETCVEVKLVDVPELGYFTSNKPPRGEVWLRGPCVTSGYLNREEETAQLFDKEGWLKTGDIGEFDERGMIRVIDRVKNLVKNLNGEYIALEKLESTYNNCNLVLSICVYADPNQFKPIAIVVPVEPALRKFAVANGLALADAAFPSLVEDQNVVAAVLAELLAVGKRSGLNKLELIQGVVLVPEEWTPENNLLTAARKLSRRNILTKYKHLVERILKEYILDRHSVSGFIRCVKYIFRKSKKKILHRNIKDKCRTSSARAHSFIVTKYKQ